MENKDKKQAELVKVPEAGLLSLIASILKDKVLFPEKLEDAKNTFIIFSLLKDKYSYQLNLRCY